MDPIKQAFQKIKQDIASFDQVNTIEREARERLNLKREGEHVFIILPNESNQASLSDDIILELYKQRKGEDKIVLEESNQVILNITSWFNFIFKR